MIATPTKPARTRLPVEVASQAQSFIPGFALYVTIPRDPPVNVSPNAHVHFSDKAKAAKLYRETARLATVSVMNTTTWDASTPTFCGPLRVKVIIGWGKGRATAEPLDHDNSVAVLKAALDGVASALGINDRLFTVAEVIQVRDRDGLGWTRVVVEQMTP